LIAFSSIAGSDSSISAAIGTRYNVRPVSAL
jgi:hypothetical protein